MNQHVHSSRYMDYVLAARFDQWRDARLLDGGFHGADRLGGRTAHVDFSDRWRLSASSVRTWVDEITRTDVRVHFEIVKQKNAKLSSDGWFLYTMVNLATGRSEPIPDWIAEKYAI